MIKFFKLTALVLATLIMVPSNALAADASVELNVNDDDVEAKIDVLLNPV